MSTIIYNISTEGEEKMFGKCFYTAMFCIIALYATSCVCPKINRSTRLEISPDHQTVIVGIPHEIVLVKIPAGEFDMGSPETEQGRFFSEDLHKVVITKDFYIARYEITQAQWKDVMGNNPAYFKGDDRPVECVNWDDAKNFCEKLNEVMKDRLPGAYQFDLPTEAQWEYACRAGTTSALNSGKELTVVNGEQLCPNVDEVAWYNKNSKYGTSNVGQKKPNAWGLYDMHGNVWEWCNDWCGDYPQKVCVDPQGPHPVFQRVYRGGAWRAGESYSRSAVRGAHRPWLRDFDIGFRLALVQR